MATSPVTLDFSKAQPVEQSVTLDFSKAQPLEAPKGAFERYWEGLKSNVPSLQGGLGTSAESTIQQFSNAHLPTWEELKASFRASPVGKAISGDVAGGFGAATPLVAMGAAGLGANAINEAAPVVGKAAAKGVNTALNYAPAAGTAIGAALAHDVAGGGAVASVVGGIAGNLIGRAINAIPRIPGAEGAPAPESLAAFLHPKAAIINAVLGKATAKSATEAAPAPTTAAPSTSDAQDLARALGLKNAQQAEQRYGKDSWAKMVAGGEHEVPAAAVRDAVTAAVDSKVPAGPVNDAATVAAGHAVAAGDTGQAQAVVNAAQNVAANPQLRWEDILDDKAWAERMRNDVDSAENAYWTYKSRLTRAGSSADVTKGLLLTPEQIVASMPAPAGTMEANKLLGYQNRPTIEQATEARNQAMSGVTAAKLKDFVRMYYGEGKELQIRPNQ